MTLGLIAEVATLSWSKLPSWKAGDPTPEMAGAGGS